MKTTNSGNFLIRAKLPLFTAAMSLNGTQPA